MPFSAGKILSNLQKWQAAIEQVEKSGGHVPEVLLDAVKTGEFDLRHSSFTNSNAKNVIFRGQKFSSKEKLLSLDLRNSSSIQKNLGDVLDEIKSLEEYNALREIDEATAFEEGSILSPILWVSQQKEDGSIKHRLIHHDRLNYTYAKPKFSLSTIGQELDRLAEFYGLKKMDLEKCFYQFRLTKSSSKTLRFKIDTGNGIKYYEWQVMCMGMSAAPFVTQATTGFLAGLYSRTFRVYVGVYLDDFWMELVSRGPEFELWAAEYGLQFKGDFTPNNHNSVPPVFVH